MSVSVEHAQLLIQGIDTLSDAQAGVIAAETEISGQSLVLDRNVAVTKADLQPSGQTIPMAANCAVTQAQFSIGGSEITLRWQGGNTLPVDAAQFSIQGIDTLSLYEIAVVAAQIQPDGQTIGGPNVVSVEYVPLTIVGSNIALDWERDDAISVDAGLVTFQPQNVELRRGTPVIRALPTIAGSDIQFQLSAGNWQVGVDTGIPVISGSDLILEGNKFFDSARPVFTGSEIVLSENANVQAAQFSITGSEITFVISEGVVFVLPAQTSVQGQNIALQKSWSVVVDTAQLSVAGQNIVFNWESDDAIVVEPALFSVVGRNQVFVRVIPVESTAISPSGQDVGRGDGTRVNPALIELFGSDIPLQFQYELGYSFGPATFGCSGSNVNMFLGTGYPTLYRVTHSYPAIEITLQSPKATKYQDYGRILNG